MNFNNASGLPGAWTMGFQRDGRETLIVIAKATYRMPAQGEPACLAPEQLPLIEADQFTGEPGFSAPLFETDFAHVKPACDVLLNGTAYAPDGRRVTHLHVGLRVGPMLKQFAVVGPRVWQRRVGGTRASDPGFFNALPLSYDVAFGGTDRTEEAAGRTDMYLANPVGLGYWRHASNVEGQPLPHTEQIGAPVNDPCGRFAPMAFSPLGRPWLPRCKFAGTYDQAWLENIAPMWPDDFDARYFQAAPADQIIPYPAGGETVTLVNLTRDGHRQFTLPTKRMPVTFIPYRGRDVTQEALLDTIVLTPDTGSFTLTWRAILPLGRSVFDVKETVLGEMSPAWHRARRFPHKTYYRDLGEAVKAYRARKGR
jgi:hypothetical protein